MFLLGIGMGQILPKINSYGDKYRHHIHQKLQNLSSKIKSNSFIQWINQNQEAQHSNGIGGACCASTSVAASQSVDDAAGAANGSGAKQYHMFNSDNSADIGSLAATAIANPLILHSSLGLWRELNHLHQKYKKLYINLKNKICVDKNSNEELNISKLSARNYIKQHIQAFRIEKHTTSWITALSSFLVLLKFTAYGVLGVGLLLSTLKSLIKVIQRAIQIGKKSLDIYYNHKQKSVCQENLNSLNQINDELNNLIDKIEQEKNPLEFIKNKIEEYQKKLAENQNDIKVAYKDLDRYPKLRKIFLQDIKLLAQDMLFWLSNAGINLAMAIANFIASGHGIPIEAILSLIGISTVGVIYSNNKLLTGRYLPGLTNAGAGKIKQGNYEEFALENAEQKFDLYHELHKIFTKKSKELNKPLSIKANFFTTKWALRILMFLSFGTYSDSMVRLRRKFKAYKAKLYKVNDEKLIAWMSEINKIIKPDNNNFKDDNLFESIKKFEKQEYIAKELVFNIAKFKSNQIKNIINTNWKVFFSDVKNLKKSNNSLQDNKMSRTTVIVNKLKQIKQKDFIILDKYKELTDFALLSIEDIHVIFKEGPCCIHGIIDDIIDDFYINLDKLKKSDIPIQKLQSLQNTFEDLLRQAVKSTFGKAGLQYANREIAQSAGIIAQYQNPYLVKGKKGEYLKYNAEKLQNLKNRIT